MTSKWRYVRAKDFCSSVRDGTHDSPKPVRVGRFLVTSRHITDGQLDLDNAYKISQADFDQANRRSKVDRWDVLISMIGTVGAPFLVKDEPIFAIKNIGLFKSNNQIEGKWLYYYLLTPEARQRIRELSRGTTQQYIPLEALRDLLIPVPDNKNEMRAIAHILGTLDDKIELNRRTNETLEAIARALFKSWFVDFDPVRAKAAGRTPQGMDAATTALFPNGFKDSELGEVPSGWRVGKVSDIATVKRDGVQAEHIRVGTPYIALDHMPKHNIALADWSIADGVVSNKSTFSQGDILFGKLRPYFHKVGIAPINGVCSTDILVIQPTFAKWYSLLIGIVSSDEFIAYTNTTSTGTKMPRTNWNDMSSYQIIIPCGDIAKRYNELIQLLLGKINANIHQSRTLATLRDVLLPRLVSGDIRVNYAARIIEE